jgi:hypothetical protein
MYTIVVIEKLIYKYIGSEMQNLVIHHEIYYENHAKNLTKRSAETIG